jgi:hypothetical protein
VLIAYAWIQLRFCCCCFLLSVAGSVFFCHHSQGIAFLGFSAWFLRASSSQALNPVQAPVSVSSFDFCCLEPFIPIRFGRAAWFAPSRVRFDLLLRFLILAWFVCPGQHSLIPLRVLITARVILALGFVLVFSVQSLRFSQRLLFAIQYFSSRWAGELIVCCFHFLPASLSGLWSLGRAAPEQQQSLSSSSIFICVFRLCVNCCRWFLVSFFTGSKSLSFHNFNRSHTVVFWTHPQSVRSNV